MLIPGFPIWEIASDPRFDKKTSKIILLFMKKRGAKFSKRLEKKIKKWQKEEN